MNREKNLAGLIDRAIYATDIAEGRLMTLDAYKSTQIPTNEDVIEPVREINQELRDFRLSMPERDEALRLCVQQLRNDRAALNWALSNLYIVKGTDITCSVCARTWKANRHPDNTVGYCVAHDKTMVCGEIHAAINDTYAALEAAKKSGVTV